MYNFLFSCQRTLVTSFTMGFVSFTWRTMQLIFPLLSRQRELSREVQLLLAEAWENCCLQVLLRGLCVSLPRTAKKEHFALPHMLRHVTSSLICCAADNIACVHSFLQDKKKNSTVNTRRLSDSLTRTKSNQRNMSFCHWPDCWISYC